MLFTATSLLAIVLPLAAAAPAPVPQTATSNLGSWHVKYETNAYNNGFIARKATALYTSPSGATDAAECSFVYNPLANPTLSTDCKPEIFTYEIVGSNAGIKLQQVVEIDGQAVTVKGEAPLVVKCTSLGGELCTGEADVVASAKA